MTEKVYVPVRYDCEDTEWGPVFARRHDAEQWVARLAEEAARDSDRWQVEERDVLERVPERVTMHYAQARKDGTVIEGSRVWWDYEAATLTGRQGLAWGRSPDEARELLGGAIHGTRPDTAG